MAMRSLQPSNLSKKGVELTDRESAKMGYIWLRCKTCGSTWQPMLDAGGRLPRYFWRCPKGCNYSK